MTMRLPEDEHRYTIAKLTNSLKPIYAESAIVDFKYWKIINNRFKHSKIADLNHMVVLKRECKSLLRIRFLEWFELLRIIWLIRHDYDCFLYNLPALSSVKNIPHAHLYKLKKEYK